MARYLLLLLIVVSLSTLWEFELEALVVPLEETTHDKLISIAAIVGMVIIAIMLSAVPFFLNEKRKKREGEEIARSESGLRFSQEIAKIAAWDHDIKNQTLWWSDQVPKILGRPPKENVVSYEAFIDSILPADQARYRECMERTIATRQPARVDHRVILADGRMNYVQAQAEVFSDEKGNIERMVGVFQDITSRKLDEQRLRLHSMVFTSAAEGIIITDKHGMIEAANPAFGELIRYSPTELVGNYTRILKSGEHDDAFYERMWYAITEYGQWRGEVVNRRKDGKMVPTEVTINSITDSTGEVAKFVAVYNDITERKKAEEDLIRLSSYDSLTGIANRRTFDEVMDKEWRRAARNKNQISLVLLDIDNFKSYNKQYGKISGDKCIRQIAQYLVGSVNRPADVVARFGGEEFAILLPETELSDALRIANTLCAGVQNLSITHEMSLIGGVVTVSGGVAVANPDQVSLPSLLIGAADRAVYNAKEAGRNCVKNLEA